MTSARAVATALLVGLTACSAGSRVQSSLVADGYTEITVTAGMCASDVSYSAINRDGLRCTGTAFVNGSSIGRSESCQSGS